jgi:hypothetical protein
MVLIALLAATVAGALTYSTCTSWEELVIRTDLL